jgi:hypothetical protein
MKMKTRNKAATRTEVWLPELPRPPGGRSLVHNYIEESQYPHYRSQMQA